MTDRYDRLTVVLKNDVRDDDAESILNAIRMVKGVMAVKPHVSDPESYQAEMRIRSELTDKLWAALHPK